MPEYRHPLAAEDEPGQPPARIHVSRADKRAVDDDGVFEAPRAVGEAIADRFDMDESDIRVVDAEPEPEPKPEPDTCEVVKADGEVCGREKPCPYHDDEGGDE